MLIKLSPVRADSELTVFKQGDSLTLNGLTLDFSPLPEGASLPATATGCEWVVGDVVPVSYTHLTLPTTPYV